MRKIYVLTLTLVSLTISLIGCGSDETSATAGGSPTTIANSGANASTIGGGPAETGSGGASSTTGSISKTAAGNGSTVVAGKTGSGGAVKTTGKGGAAEPRGGAGGTTAPISDGGQPAPVDTPYVWGLGVGITDIPKATDFYTKIMGMVVEKDGAVRDVGKPDERTETILYAAEAKRGARLVLIKYKDGRNTEKITAKLVWNTPNGTATVATAAAAGYATIYSMGINAQIYGPETYVHEFTTGMDSGGTGITVPYLIAVGFAVSDMNASIQFYGDAFGMTSSPTGSWPVTDANGSATITENTVKLTTGAGLVLQTWVSTPPRNTKDNPVKVIIFVPDAKSYADKVVAAGGKIVEPAKREATYDNRTVVEAKDLDGYWLEIVQ